MAQARLARAVRRIALPTVLITAVTGWLAWRGWEALRGYGPLRSIHAGQAELAGPVVLGFVFVVFVIEQFVPAERHKVLARGHVLDVGYLFAHALVVVPMIILIGTGFSDSLARVAPWMVLPRNDGIPHWFYIVIAVVAIDAVDWLAHLANHQVSSLWRLHAVHHSQEELSILSTFRTHPLVHVSFVISAIPVLALASNAATPAAVLTAYACLGALPHANVRWSYGPLGKVFVSPAYHRLASRTDRAAGHQHGHRSHGVGPHDAASDSMPHQPTSSHRPASPDAPSRWSSPASDRGSRARSSTSGRNRSPHRREPANDHLTRADQILLSDQHRHPAGDLGVVHRRCRAAADRPARSTSTFGAVRTGISPSATLTTFSSFK